MLPVLAFAALVLPLRRADRGGRLRLVAAAAGTSLFLVLLSTGTNNPGEVMFAPLYRLPYGWLLREPGRFLMAAGLTYAVLVACALDALPGMRAPRLSWRPAWSRIVVPAAAALVLLLALVPAYPLIDGTVVTRPGDGLPGKLVAMPAYWADMATYINGLPGDGRVVVMPPDDFYQMPYRWGFYGSDGFIQQSLTRGALVPNGDGYTPASAQLRGVVAAISAAALAGDWTLLDRLLEAVHAPYLLVRSDLDTALPGRQVTSAKALTAAFDQAPGLRLAREAGALRLYRREPAGPLLSYTTSIATVESHNPDMRVLARLPQGTELVETGPQVGLPLVLPVPPVTDWTQSSTSLSVTIPAPSGWTYRLVSTDATGKIQDVNPATLGRASSTPQPGGAAAGSRAQPGPGRQVRPPVSAPPPSSNPGGTAPGTLSVTNEESTAGPVTRLKMNTGANLVGSPGFAAFSQDEPGNCSNRSGAGPGQGLFASLLDDAPGGGRAVRLRALLDSACIQRPLAASAGTLLLTMDVRNVQGSVPRVCLWEEALQRCAVTPDPPAERDWRHYSALVTPDAGAGALDLFVYADNDVRGIATVNDYANVAAVPVPAAPPIAVIGTPLTPAPAGKLVTLRETDSTGWVTPAGARRVVVDGMMPGFLLPPGVPAPAAIDYAPDRSISAAFGVSLISLGLLLLLGPAAWLRRRRRPRPTRFGPQASTQAAPGPRP